MSAVLDRPASSEQDKEHIVGGYMFSKVQISGALEDGNVAPFIPDTIGLWHYHHGDEHLVSRRLIGVRLWKEDNAFFASNDSLGITAAGNTSQDALQDFQEQVIHFFQYYRDLREDQVTGLAAHLRRQFAELFEVA